MNDADREGRLDTPFVRTDAVDASPAPERPTPLAKPRSIGRYELVHELGQGGMATVFLARIRGPGGFLKWVAIKTIHGHMSMESRIIDMFLDEARIAASIQHPNVVQLLDFGQEGGELYITMEYLHGEHLRAVSDAAHRTPGGFPFEIAAHIIAETARGLHHAHEAKDATGRPLSIVHRDLSPHNIIVTYDGVAKLTDFGVAKATGRLSKTISGRVKGKWAYMAPEQVLGEGIDRRADIFALGTVLWEITTGGRLFKAESDVRTVMRITSGRAPPPSSVISKYPDKLERIVMRALSRRPADRYPTAAAMAEELDEFIALSGRQVGGEDVAQLMGTIFSTRIALKEEMLRHEASKALSQGLTTIVTEPTSVTAADPQREGISPSSSEGGTLAPINRRRPVGVPLALIAISLGVILVFFLSSDQASVVRVASHPSGATVILDGVPQAGSTPTVIHDISHGRHQVELQLQGFESFRATFDVEGGEVELSYHLRREELAATDPLSGSGSELHGSQRDARYAKNAGGETKAGVRTSDTDAFAPQKTGEREGSLEDATPRKTSVGTERSSSKQHEVAYLNLLARPWAKVWINGRSAGQTPLMRHPVPAGPIVVRLQREGRGETRTLRLHAEPGQTISRQVDLSE